MFYWSIVDLQCGDSFQCTAKWFGYTYIFFFIFFSIMDYWKKWKLLVIHRVWLFVTPWTVVCQAPLSMGFSRQEYWRGLPFPSPGESSQPRDGTWVSCIAGRVFTIWANILLHDGLSQDFESSSLCSTVGPCCLSILCITVCIYCLLIFNSNTYQAISWLLSASVLFTVVGQISRQTRKSGI